MRCVRRCVRIVPLFLTFVLAFGEAGSPGPVISTESRAAAPAMVIGFVGGFVKHNDRVHSTVQVVEHLRNEYPDGVYVQSFANRHRDRAYKEVLRRLDGNHDGKLSAEEKQQARRPPAILEPNGDADGRSIVAPIGSTRTLLRWRARRTLPRW